MENKILQTEEGMVKGNWSIQVIPMQDKGSHDVNFPELCDCIVRVDDETGVIVHSAFDKRQKFENKP